MSVTPCEVRFAKIENGLAVLKWIGGVNVTLTLLALGKLFVPAGH